ncbi:MAG: glycosyltransferase family 87 protein [Terriglobales bacterium]
MMLILLAAVEFIVRGPLRFSRSLDFNDFVSPVVQTRAWLNGADPYEPASLMQFWPSDIQRPDFLRSDSVSGTLIVKRGIPTAYPPTSFVLLTPFAVIPSWRVAALLWIGLCTAMFAGMLFAMWRFGDFASHTNHGYLLTALVLGLAPFHTGFAAGSIAIFVVPLCALAFFWAQNQEVVSAILTAVVIGLKPQIGIPLLFYFGLRKQWKLIWVSLSVLAVIAVVAITRLAISHTPWLSNYAMDNTVLLGQGSLGDFTELNPLRFGLINCQVLTYVIFGKRCVANLAGFSVAGFLGLAWLYLFFRTPVSRSPEFKMETLTVSALFVISLLPVYHRFYDASLLIFPLIWACLALRNFPERRHGIIALVLIAPFFIPGGTVLQQLTANQRIPVSIGQSWWWRVIIMPHEIWALLLLAVVLLSAMHANIKMKLSS